MTAQEELNFMATRAATVLTTLAQAGKRDAKHHRVTVTMTDGDYALLAEVLRRASLQDQFVPLAVEALRQHVFCGDQFPDDGWPEVLAALAVYDA